jgi:hypothetical protein
MMNGQRNVKLQNNFLPRISVSIFTSVAGAATLIISF